MKKNKFIPLAVLAGLCVVAVAMNNQQCTAKESKSPCGIVSCKKNPEQEKKCKTSKGCKNRKTKKATKENK